MAPETDRMASKGAGNQAHRDGLALSSDNFACHYSDFF
ncbi:hypothetical protein A8V49_06725 [Yersinia pestis]|nr:hypothetical protein AVJ24_19790 [Yersinia pestis]PCN67328.1 hypothetical protein A8V49_06725 [Yersinia pestis]